MIVGFYLNIRAMNEIELRNKNNQLVRLLISYNDMKNAMDIAAIIIEENYERKMKEFRGKEKWKYKKIWEALNCSMILAYNRPFSGNDKGKSNPIPDLCRNVLKVLNDEELKMHVDLIEERNSFMAHSDSDAVNMRPHSIATDGQKKGSLIPLQHDTMAPYMTEYIIIIRNISKKVMEEIFRRRMILEKELEDYYPVVDYKKE